MQSSELLALLTALGHPQRLRIVAELTEGRTQISVLTRRLGLSRPLLHLHLDRLRQVGLLSTDGVTHGYVELAPFAFELTPGVVHAAFAEDRTTDKEEGL